MLTIPVDLMLTIDSIPSSFTSQFPAGTSIHGILAAFLTHGDPALLKHLDAWRRVWPSFDEFEDSMPVLWPAHLRVSNSSYEANANPSSAEKQDQDQNRGKVLLPPSISGEWNTFSKVPVGVDYDTRYQNLLSQQEKRLKDAWTNVLKVYPETEWKTFAYYWCIINSRSFYYVSPGKDEPEDWNDAIGMVPFADYFNHVDDAVGLSFLSIPSVQVILTICRHAMSILTERSILSEQRGDMVPNPLPLPNVYACKNNTIQRKAKRST